MEFEEYVTAVEKRGNELVCPIGCSGYGYLCSGNPYNTPCGQQIEVDQKGNEVS